MNFKLKLKIKRNIPSRGINMNCFDIIPSVEINLCIDFTGAIIYDKYNKEFNEIIKSDDDRFPYKWKNILNKSKNFSFKNSYLIDNNFILINIPNSTVMSYLSHIKSSATDKEFTYYKFTSKEKEKIKKYFDYFHKA